MENRKNKSKYSLLLIFILLNLQSCDIKEVSTKKENSENYSVDSTKHSNFIPDTSVNNILSLENPTTSKIFFPTVDKLPVIEKMRESPIVILSNRTNSEYLILYKFESSTLNSFGKFELLDSLKSDLVKATITTYENFATESGLKLGLTLNEVVSKKGPGFLKEGDFKIVYRISDFNKSDFLRRYNMPGYTMECIFKNGILCQLIYGFENP